MICAIHQPNFFPWLGYFDKIYRADVFVFMDSVDYPKSSKTMSSWTNRVQLLINRHKTWVHCPIRREHGIQKICDVEIDDTQDWRKRLLRTIQFNYAKSPFYAVVMPFVEEWVNGKYRYIADYNIAVIKDISKMFHLTTKFVRQTDLLTEKHSTELLVEITKRVGCDTYLCGGGAGGYQQDEMFPDNGLLLQYQNFVPYEYNQGRQEFVGGLSILDALFHQGIAGVEQSLKMGMDSLGHMDSIEG